ncbi:ATP-binding protein [Rubinisphaera sp.]|uniref:ATP-binding protein n=1 Tax=Rubinisphaera sp. TaxID=2024857 RepID=UPI000C0F2D29|nr:ATP-binding protein [Rubinisphaera sp.]MBV10843.1 histidine kinase [Rubinisphaera sp.]HCS53918.1 ATP-binding protein [Planctomycetaceae bacterium]|tara:strand:- start:6614 stop:9571 length:2958 start_codon:yes stop_codon:yes gene_type:complete
MAESQSTQMADKAFFQTRARAIDHLGRGQIADCPTAVTELWKNSHDAYARQTSLHIFEGTPPVAAIYDDGCGMTIHDVLNRWLIVGTESKATDSVQKSDRFGLTERPKLGEKGIGRLSAGFLAPVTLLVTKKAKARYASALVDWRFFENPFLLISDIQIPRVEFDSLESLPVLLSNMIKLLKNNLSGANAATKKDAQRVREAWKNFTKQERDEGIQLSTESQILALESGDIVSNKKLSFWSVARDEVDHGTAIFLINLNKELSAWVDPRIDSEDMEAKEARDDLKRTLTGFIEPEVARKRNFNYHVEVHTSTGSKIRLDSEDQVTSEYLQTLEHYFKGEISEKGWFSGEVTAFGKSHGNVRFNLNIAGLANENDILKVGPFSLEIATIEQDPKNSSHEQSDQDAIKKLQDVAGGMMVYRDGVRVLPYGRPDSDFFGLEERRGKNAGREVWSHRRVFGRIFISRTNNPNLKDKAGREGLVENQAKRLMRSMVIAVLMETARRYFGSSSPIREKELARIEARNAKGRASTQAARKIKRKEFLSKLRSTSSAVMKTESTLQYLSERCKTALNSKDGTNVASILKDVGVLRNNMESLDLPMLPKGLEEREEQYREARDRIEEIRNQASDLESKLATKLASLKASEPDAVVEDFRQKQILAFSKQTTARASYLTSKLRELAKLWESRLSHGPSELDDATLSFVDAVSQGESIAWAMEEIQAEVDRFSLLLIDNCRSVTNAVELLIEGVDLDSALRVSDEGEMSANERVQQLNLLAQCGIAVELISHELEELSSETEHNLKRLPESARSTVSYKRALTAFASLVDRFRFLSPLSVATYRARREISGNEIATYIDEFFVRRFESADVDFASTKAFESILFRDVPSRIFPVFINLVNNSLYWMKFTKKKKQIRFDFKDGLVIVADSGPGVDPDDVDNLFQMFFTKRPQGRGIGLYLCKANLAVARHAIRYATPSDPKILPGANFIIEFRGIND